MLSGLVVYIVLVTVVRRRARSYGRWSGDRRAARFQADQRADLSDAFVAGDGRVEHPGPELVLIRTHFAVRALAFWWGPFIVVFAAQWIFGWSPWLSGIAVAAFKTLEAVYSQYMTIDSSDYRPLAEGRRKSEWTVLLPALTVRGLAVAAWYVCAAEGITSWEWARPVRPLVWMTASLVILAAAHLPPRLAERFVRRSRQGIFASETPANAVLFLRSFADDDASIAAPLDIGFVSGPLLALRRPRFEEFVAATIAASGPLVAIGRPGERLPELGSSRTYWADDQWQTAVLATVPRAERVILVAGLSGGVAWEISQLRKLNMLRKVLVLMPPANHVDSARRLERVVSDLGIESFPHVHYQGWMVTAVGFDEDDRPVLYTCDGRTFDAYMWAITRHHAVLTAPERVRRTTEPNPATTADRPSRERVSGLATVGASAAWGRGRSLLAAGDPEGALDIWREALAAGGLSPNVKLTLLEAVAENTTEVEEAIRAYNTIIEVVRGEKAGAARLDLVQFKSLSGFRGAEDVIVSAAEALARLHHLDGNVDATLAALDLAAAEAHGSMVQRRAAALRSKVKVASDAGRFADAREFARAAVVDATSRHAVVDEIDARLADANACAAAADLSAVAAVLAGAAATAAGSGDRHLEAATRLRCAHIRIGAGDQRGAIADCDLALTAALAATPTDIVDEIERALRSLMHDRFTAGDSAAATAASVQLDRIDARRR